MIIYVTEADEIEAEALALLAQSGHTLVTTREEALARAGEIEVLFIRTYTNVTAEYLDDFPQVKYILRAGVGLDNIDIGECKKRNIGIINSPGANANAVAEYVIGIVISALRNLSLQTASLQAGSWRKKEFVGNELKGKTLGLVGCGNVGKVIAHKLSTWELAEVIGYDPYLTQDQLAAAGIRKCELAEVIGQADIISLHVPLMPETRHLIGAAELARMKPGALLVNAARGGVVDESELVQALKEKHIAAAVLDVFEHEPDVGPELLVLANAIVTPHIAGYTCEANQEVSLAPVRELLRRLG